MVVRVGLGVLRSLSGEDRRIRFRASCSSAEIAEPCPVSAGHGRDWRSPTLYPCFVDESGRHRASPVLVVGGIVIHEEDAWV